MSMALHSRGRRRVLRLGGGAITTVLLDACALAPHQPDVSKILENTAPAVFGIGDASSIVGSGFRLAGTNTVVTAAHVVRAATGALKVKSQGQGHDARLVRLDEDADLAVLDVDPASSLPGLQLSLRPARLGQWVLVLGCPFGSAPTATIGIVSGLPGAVLEPPALARRLQLNAAINAGNSGGPVIDLDGNVIAIANATVPGGYGLGFAVPAQALSTLLPAGLPLSRTAPGS